MATSQNPEPQQTNMVAPPHNSPPADLRRMTSNSTLLTPSHREHRLSSHTSQHLQTGSARMGSRSPSSIPSSPTSAHSSSSAIFERDIEPIGPPSPPNHSSHPPNPHRIPRSKGTEQLEQSVPSVLDSAASILAASSPMEEDHIAVVTPARERDRGFRSGFASPIGSLRSRSPSPTRSPLGHRTSLLLSVPGSPSAQPPATLLSSSPKEPQARLTIQTSPAVVSPSATATTAKKAGRSSPSINTPTSAYYSTLSSVESSPTTTTVEHPPQMLSPPVPVPQTQPPLAISPSSTYTGSPYAHPLNLSHPPSPTHGASKRLSFMSYTDLLASTPVSMVPLSSFTTCVSSDPPPHIAGVTGFGNTQSSGGSIHGGIGRGDRDSIALLDDVGGEWEREGLGRGLEERLEALMAVPGKA
ncbi:hypothetical protein HYDPIDRAFT_116679 [Hydnomerulius pinastri MD-312]|uniref:Uncharacterized protein n=1 Tax=Hydnomerulius pinastri MD-312 TaxID=994086 RepID=A0A0C9WB02_9AGAM|nr:hypothetical protein HYDPIDRAFT_116679 [Hydnomerulius pinastri MD-312]